MTGTDTLERAAESETAENAGRAGLAARGVMYCVVAALVVRVIFGADEQLDREGVLEALVRHPVGYVGVVALAAGFAGYAFWRFAEALSGKKRGTDETMSAPKRILQVGHALIYIGALGVALRVLASGHGSRPNETEREWTASLLQATAGRWIVGAVGLGLLCGGAYLAWRGLSERFRRKIDEAEMPEWQRRWLPRLGMLGYASRGAVLAIIGWFVMSAAVEFDAKEAVGIDGALKRLLGEPYGKPALAAIAAGLLAFGLFSFVEARYREILGRSAGDS